MAEPSHYDEMLALYRMMLEQLDDHQEGCYSRRGYLDLLAPVACRPTS